MAYAGVGPWCSMVRPGRQDEERVMAHDNWNHPAAARRFGYRNDTRNGSWDGSWEDTGDGGRRLSLSDELAVALHTIDDFGRSIQSADAKAGALAAVLGLLIGSLVNDASGSPRTLLVAEHATGVPGMLFGGFLVSLLAAGVSLGLTQVPRLATGRRTCRLSFPSVAGSGVGSVAGSGGRPTGGAGTVGGPDGGDVTDDAWHQAGVLAAIAMTKFRYLRIALVTTGTCVITFVSWLVTVTMLTR
jgi:hypothetical protein